MAGQIAEIARDERGDFRNYDPGTARILIVEALDRILTSFPESLSAKALRALESLGVTGRIGESVVDVDADSVTVRRADDSTERIPTRTVIWAAGVNASPLARTLAERAGLEVDRAGRLEVLGDLSVDGHPEVLADRRHGHACASPTARALVLPGVAPVAMQQGRHAARVVARPPRRPRAQAVPATSTRATSPPSGAPARWPTSRACTSAASSRGSRGSSSTSGT